MNFFKWLVQSRYRGRIFSYNESDNLLQAADPVNQEGSPASGVSTISPHLSDNLQRVKEVFKHCSDFNILPWQYGPELSYAAFSIYFDSVVQKKDHNYFRVSLQDQVIHELGQGTMVTPEDIKFFFSNKGASSDSAILVEDFNEAVNYALEGHLVIFFDQWNKALSFNATNLETRQVTESVTEPVVKGPRESTVENLSKNLGMLRTRLKTPNFKIETLPTSGQTRTKVAYGYLDGTVNPEMLAEFQRRIAKLQNKEILETSYIEESIEDSTYSPFPQYRYTERTDVAVAALLEGKIIVLVEGTGSILICPGLLFELLQSSEDYYQRTVISSIIRVLRLVALFIAIGLPSVYIAFSTFHPELIPTVLLLAVVNSREGIPFPAVFEALIMEFFFELLREAGIRLPRPVGSAVSIVGALVIGEAAINAGIASPIMVIIVALTGIASFSIPQYNFAIALRILRFPLMLFAAVLGIFGILIAFMLIWLHLANLRSLGQPYLSPVGPFIPRQMRDVIVRAPLEILMRSPRNRHMRKP
ncbi:spore germination protein [Paenibacillus sedimenti]|uniref:Spore germination protein n=1 Tax=Paenibacillus sedimenti TaxID=2770274 RepID=A0A926KQ00_9BACL|nr:spore germination protein [Paenibacillus sedimenti]MBD0381031.1 spore germination protein [Paenibacillus sedimenti]